MIFLQDIIVSVRDYLDEADSDNSDFTDSELTRYISREQDYLATKIRNVQQDFFCRRFTFALTSGTIEYYLPRDVINLRLVENITSGVSGTAPFFTIDEDDRDYSIILPQGIDSISGLTGDDFRYSGENQNISLEKYSLFGHRMIFTPGQNLTGHIRLWYTSHVPSMHYGTIAAATSTTVTLSSTPTVGLLERGNNIYQEMLLGIYSGTGIGGIGRITEYVESTRVATVDSAFGTTPSGSAVYSIISPVPEQMSEMLSLGACIRARGRIDDSTDFQTMMYTGMQREFLNEIDPRIRQGVRRVRHV